MRYFIISKSDFTIKEVKDDSWFSTPIKKLGPYNDLMCEIDTFGGYDAKYSWASKHNYNAEFYTRGTKSSFCINGWTFPKEISHATDSSSRDARIFNEFSFKCIMPNNLPLFVKVKVDKPYIWGIMKAFNALINMSESSFNSCSFMMGNERHISLNSYIYLNSCVKEYYL